MKINLLMVMMSTALLGVGYLGYIKYNASRKEGACPVTHSQREEMVKLGRK